MMRAISTFVRRLAAALVPWLAACSDDTGQVAWVHAAPDVVPGTLLGEGDALHTVVDASGARLRLSGRGHGTLRVALSPFDTEREGSGPARTSEIAVAGSFDERIELGEARTLRVELTCARTAEGVTVEALELERTSRPPAIVFLSMDTLAARHMSLYGYERPTTPNLERFAASSIVFDHCRANGAWTKPSYASQLSGLYPQSLRAGSGTSSAWGIPASRWTLAEALRAGGYSTAAFVDNPFVSVAAGYLQGFDHVDDSAAQIGAQYHEGGLEHMIPRALDWLDALDPNDVAMLFLQAIDVHGPYLARDEWRGRFADTPAPDHELPVSRADGAPFQSIPEHIGKWVDEDETLALDELPKKMGSARFVDAYDEEILAMDAELGRLLDALEARGVLDHAVVVLGADHGEAAGEHDAWFSHMTVGGEVLHVPLLVRLPGGAHGGRRIADTVQMVDLAPTLLELAGLDARRAHLHGRSLVPLLHGDSLPPRPAFSFATVFEARSIEYEGWKLIAKELTHDGGLLPFLTAPEVHAWLGERFPELEGRLYGTDGFDWDFFEGKDLPALLAEFRADHEAKHGPIVYELYDLANDLGETDDVAGDRPDKVAELRRMLELEEGRALEARERVPPSYDDIELSPAELQELKNLGYAGE